jgi:hypothetical protein
VVKEAIENRTRHHRIAEHRPPLADAAIAAEQDRTSLTGLRVVRELDRIVELRGCPRRIVSDKSPSLSISV